jgi:uncharacterized membrane protein YozB (DUF420 family)
VSTGVWALTNEAGALFIFALELSQQTSAPTERIFMKGFLGTWASFSADLNLLVQIAMGLALLGGAFLARAKRYTAHGICQAAVLILNVPMIALVMWPSLHSRVLPKLSSHFGKRYYASAVTHGILGAVAELLGLYILLVAGTNILPNSWRLESWKLWMRIELVLWWIVLLSGFVIYYIWYAAPQSR